MLAITKRNVTGVSVLDLSGTLTLGDEGESLRNAILSEFAGGSRRIAVNFRDVCAVDSSGIGELVGAYASVTRQGGPSSYSISRRCP